MIAMNRLKLAVIASMLIAPPLLGQGGPPGDRAQMLRSRVEETFLRRAQQQLALTDEQAERMMAVVRSAGEERRALEAEERTLRASLQQELRPGVAARVDSVNYFVEAISRNRVTYAQSFQKEMQALQPILTPAQRGQYLQMRDQLLQRVQELQQSRPGNAAAPSRGRRP
ncbi:MAG: hypothetical protein CVV20_01135 [Gemmatimonadetes bacterium HGW-Gemmatimonadetes-1]|nr:MAG: hypothetical protein CVV20_01135 [Gemmatimonadetes bacterium HGW-Gemmatimonadetes-1]